MNHYQTTILSVYDGDTATVDLELGFEVILKSQKIRFYGVDTPEIRTSNQLEKQAGLLARDRVRELLPVGSRRPLYSPSDKRGKYGRILGDFGVMVDGHIERLSEVLVREHLAIETFFHEGLENRKQARQKNFDLLLSEGRIKQ